MLIMRYIFKIQIILLNEPFYISKSCYHNILKSMRKKNNAIIKFEYILLLFITLIVFLFFDELSSVINYIIYPTRLNKIVNINTNNINPPKDSTSSSSSSYMSSSKKEKEVEEKGKVEIIIPLKEEDYDEVCSDSTWCDVNIPDTSYFNFDPPTDINRWKRAQLQAVRGEQVLLRRIAKYFPHPLNFLDGDRSFRKLHLGVDVFMDERRWLSSITNKGIIKSKQEKPYEWETKKVSVIPRTYDYISAGRVPVVQLGYITFKRDNNQFFMGNFQAGHFTTRFLYIIIIISIHTNINLYIHIPGIILYNTLI